MGAVTPAQSQAALAAVLAVMLALFAWRRWRHDVVAVAGLLAATVLGLVPAGRMLSGFSHPAVAIVPALLVLAAGLRSSGLLAAPVRLLAPWLGRPGVQVAALGGMGASVAAALGAHGAAAAFGPAPAQALRRSGNWPSPAMGPISFALTLGGLATLVGTVPNLLVSELRRDMVGVGYGLFAFAPVGLALALAGIAFMAVAWRLLPHPRQDTASRPVALADGYVSEVHVPAASPAVGLSVAELERRGDGAVRVAAVIREDYRRLPPRPDLLLEADDVLAVSSGLDALQRFVERLQLRIAGTSHGAPLDPERMGVVEAVVTPASRMVGQSYAGGGLGGQLSLLGIGRSGGAPPMRLHRVKLQAGDVLVAQGELASMAPLLTQYGCLPLAERRLRLGRRRQALAPALLLVGALALAAAGTAPLVLALLGAVVLLVVLRNLSLEELYASVDWSQVVLLGALLPVSAAIRDTGLTGLAAGWLAEVATPAAAVALVLAGALALAPLITGIAAALLLAPVAAGLAAPLGASVDPFLMALAAGASCNFLTQALAPAPPGWGREPGAWRLGLPLTLLVFALGLPLVLLAWPLHP